MQETEDWKEDGEHRRQNRFGGKGGLFQIGLICSSCGISAFVKELCV